METACFEILEPTLYGVKSLHNRAQWFWGYSILLSHSWHTQRNIGALNYTYPKLTGHAVSRSLWPRSTCDCKSACNSVFDNTKVFFPKPETSSFFHLCLPSASASASAKNVIIPNPPHHPISCAACHRCASAKNVIIPNPPHPTTSGTCFLVKYAGTTALYQQLTYPGNPRE